MTLQEIIYTIKGSLGSDAEELTNRQYKFIIDYYRAKLLRQRLKAKELVSPVFAPAIHKIQLKEIEDSDPGMALEANVYKTVKDIPTIIPHSKEATLLYLGSTDGFLPFQETSFQVLDLEQHTKYIRKQPKWFLLGTTIYVTNPPDEAPEYITIQGIFEDPLAAAALSDSFDPTTLINFNVDYAISGDMVDTIIKLIRDNELQGLLKELDEDDNSQR
jgi:hypothetical protein